MHIGRKVQKVVVYYTDGTYEEISGAFYTPTPTYPVHPLVQPAPHTQDHQTGCRVCGIGKNGEPMGYVCPRTDCPTRVYCVNTETT